MAGLFDWERIDLRAERSVHRCWAHCRVAAAYPHYFCWQLVCCQNSLPEAHRRRRQSCRSCRLGWSSGGEAVAATATALMLPTIHSVEYHFLRGKDVAPLGQLSPRSRFDRYETMLLPRTA